MQTLIGVIGNGACDMQTSQFAERVGRAIAHHGFGLVCGGLGGVMEAAARGCQQNGGITVGIIPQEMPAAANPYIDIVIPSGMGVMRNLLLVRAAKGLIAVGGRFGTLSEIAFALQLQKPVVALHSWEVSDKIIIASDPDQAVEKLVERLEHV